jgi:hypothetical protein
MTPLHCARDVVRARFLIEEGARLYGHGAMVDAAQLQASQGRMAALDAARRDVMSSYPEADPDDRWSDEREPNELDEGWGLDEPR